MQFLRNVGSAPVPTSNGASARASWAPRIARTLGDLHVWPVTESMGKPWENNRKTWETWENHGKIGKLYGKTMGRWRFKPLCKRLHHSHTKITSFIGKTHELNVW